MHMYLLTALISFFAGAVYHAWWIRPDIKKYKQELSKLKNENEQFRRHILRNFKVKMYQRGVEIDPDQ